MYSKTTDELEHEITSATNAEDFIATNKEQMIRQSLSEHLNDLLKNKGIRKADAVRKSLLERGYAYEIFSDANKKVPSRDKLIAIAFGLGLTLDETQKMLKLSGSRELYPRDERDALIMVTLQRKGSISDLYDLLEKHELEELKFTSK